MACPKPVKNQLTDFYIYRVDVGSSREFDQDLTDKVLDSDTPIDMENKYLFSKTPQILAINRKGEQDIITIIKSKMKNTRIHLPRPIYETIINNSPSLKGLDLSNPYYLQTKYLKYKKKYLELKKII